MQAEILSDVQAELEAAGLPPAQAAAIRIVESGWYTGLPYLPTATGDVAIETWRRLRHLCSGRRHPVIVDEAGGRAPAERLPPSFPAVSDMVAEGWRMDVRDQWRGLLAAELDRFYVAGGKWPRRSAMTDVHGEWPTGSICRHRLVGPYWGHTAGHPTADVLLPGCPEPWMVPTYLRADCHNALPGAAVQCAVFRAWYRRFGAEVVYTNGVVYEFVVARPPEDRERAMQLAREHYLFCPDRVDQVCPDSWVFPPAVRSLEGLASRLMKSSVWYFWWD